MVPGYREVRQLGAGHTGRVFLATYQSTGAYVAIKYLNATLRRDAEFMERFRVDAPALVEIDDPNVVKLYEYVETQTRAAVVMELVDGVSLRTLLDEHGRTSPEAALAVLKGTLLALAMAHDKGVLHRDVKPENVLVQADGTTKLGDFGVVVHAEEPGVPAGSPPYMSPELWTRGQAGPPADLYAAACVLFEAVKGRPPFRADDVPGLRDMHLVEPVPLEVVPDTLRDLLRRGLAKDPALRYASARQFAAELEEDAVAGYGPDWEQRGRRHLAELATLLALRFPLARADAGNGPAPVTVRERLSRVPRLPPHLWIAAATVLAVLVTLMLSGGQLPPGPGTVLMPRPETAGELDPADETTPARSSEEGEPSSSAPAPTASRPAGSQPAVPTPTAIRTGAPTVPATTGPPTTGPPTTGPTATPTVRRSANARPVVRSADIVQWSGSVGEVRVTADGTGPVRLRITYTVREGDGPAQTVGEESRTLSGRTLYTSGVTRAPGSVTCGVTTHFGIVVLTEPAAGNGPQVSEVAVDGAACPATPTRSAVQSPSQDAASAAHTPSPEPTEESLSLPTDSPSAEEPLSLPTGSTPAMEPLSLSTDSTPAEEPLSLPTDSPSTEEPLSPPTGSALTEEPLTNSGGLAGEPSVH
ncbi:protein kinase domain-containing protein [Nonomuraea cavernae]|uniref:protein kinase domain-containing protein n=1 Tax=Nonomuraea cavernae TaxID=2045107 RepID=UPI0033E49F77